MYFFSSAVFRSYVVCLELILHTQQDEVAEWLRRQTANLLCSARVSSNLILVETCLFPFL